MLLGIKPTVDFVSQPIIAWPSKQSKPPRPMMELAECDSVFHVVGATVCTPMDMAGVNAGCLAVQDRMESAKRAAVPEILQYIDGKLPVALRLSAIVQAVEP
ncbi:MAG: hypothetical protein HUU20_23260 [Pirellulales bacterium]|nr:hypothetical protein [Pirellulales bacterium]